MALTSVQVILYTTVKINAEVQMERIRQLRKERGLSQAKLAVMADMDPATLNRLERGTGNPNLKTLERVAAALEVEVTDFFPKARRSSPEPSLFNGADDEQSSIIADYERLLREHRIAWRDALEALAAPWTDRIAAGTFDRGMVEQFFTDVAAISQSVSRALRATIEEESTVRWKYKAAPTADDINEMWATAISPAGTRLLEVSDQVYAAALERFSESELEMVRSKRDEARRAFAHAA